MLPPDCVDLHDLAAIFLYEALSTEPRLRHTKLMDVGSTNVFQTCTIPASQAPEFFGIHDRDKRSFLFYQNKSDEGEERDTPSNMVSEAYATSAVRSLSEDEKEMIYYQSRSQVSEEFQLC